MVEYFMQFKVFRNENVVQGTSDVSFSSMKNHQRAIRFLKSLSYKNIKPKNLIWAEQIFGSRVRVCKKEDGGKKIKGVDGLISNLPNQILSILTADCLPILMYDKKKKVVAALHGGRECLIKGILEKAVEKMKKKFKSQSKDILVAIGPHIRVCHYWLRGKTYQKLKETNWKKYFLKKKGKVYPVPFTGRKNRNHIVSSEKRCGVYFNLTKLAVSQLLKSGIKKENIEDCKICTYCHYKNFFSFRKSEEKPEIYPAHKKIMCGVYPEKNPRFASFIGLLNF